MWGNSSTDLPICFGFVLGRLKPFAITDLLNNPTSTMFYYAGFFFFFLLRIMTKVSLFGSVLLFELGRATLGSRNSPKEGGSL